MKILTDIKNCGRLSFKSSIDFPLNPEMGELCFKDDILYIHTIVAGFPRWLSLTNNNVVTYYIHEQKTPSNLWTINHELNSKDLMFQVYNEFNELVLANIKMIDEKSCQIVFSSDEQGKCLLLELSSKSLESASNIFISKSQLATDEQVIEGVSDNIITARQLKMMLDNFTNDLPLPPNDDKMYVIKNNTWVTITK